MKSGFKTIPYEQVLVFGNMRAEVFYKTTEWRRLRYFALKTLGNRCQVCGASAALSPLQVDHVKPRLLFPELSLDIHNLQILCEDCHVAKTCGDMDDNRNLLDSPAPPQLRDIFRVQRFHLVLELRPPRNFREAKILMRDVRSTSCRNGKPWKSFVLFMYYQKITYRDAATLRVGVFKHLIANGLAGPTGGGGYRPRDYESYGYGKHDFDLLFDIKGLNYPPRMSDLLADEQRTHQEVAL